MKNTFIPLFAAILLFISCGRNKDAPVTRSFYYWKSEFLPGNAEKETLSQLNISRLYVKFFDVKWEEGVPRPVADIHFETPASAVSQEIVPVIFITNETLAKLSADETKTLAFKISKHLEYLLQQNKLNTPREVQLDCDWSESTEEQYFTLISEMKKYPAWKDIQWSATIRLHQIKFRERTGVPPVDRGMLMFYNMGTIDDAASVNSIYDTDIAALYTERIGDYPLPLDAGIACFSWGLLFDGGKLLQILYPLYPEELPDSLFTRSDGNHFIARDNFYFEGSYIVKGNSIRLETMTPDLSAESAALLADNLKSEQRSVILYHLDSAIITNYTNENLEKIYRMFEH